MGEHIGGYFECTHIIIDDKCWMISKNQKYSFSNWIQLLIIKNLSEIHVDFGLKVFYSNEIWDWNQGGSLNSI